MSVPDTLFPPPRSWKATRERSLDHPVRQPRLLVANSMNDQVSLPIGWYFCDEATKTSLLDELKKEMVDGHLLYGKRLTVIADTQGAFDDILLRHDDNPQRF